MKVVVQRVKNASVTVDNQVKGKINNGLLLLVGIEAGDSHEDVEWMAQKILNLRIFGDENGKMNLSVLDVSGEILCISQFTLIADYKKGNRPSFIRAAKANEAVPLFESFKASLAAAGVTVQSGVFGGDMKVSLVNDGPVTIVMDSRTKT